ncbi:MAG: hypothetical protein HYZ68_04695 [Chloroflexi bacterium]|nr:hypothetical protein [Chloroflexota bacterium]
MKRTIFLTSTAIAAVFLAACAAPTPAPPTEGGPSFEIVSPTGGATVGSEVTLELSISNLTVVEPGAPLNPSQGHFHIFLDGGSDYEVVYSISHTLSNLAPGDHKVRVELRQNNHSPFDPPVVREVNFTAGEAAGGAPAYAMEILSPIEGSVVSGPDVTVQLKLVGLQLVEPGGYVYKGEGHFHIFLDQGGYDVVASDTHTITGLAPGPHTIRAEFRNNNHSPYNPPLVAVVNFTVR